MSEKKKIILKIAYRIGFIALIISFLIEIISNINSNTTIILISRILTEVIVVTAFGITAIIHFSQISQKDNREAAFWSIATIIVNVLIIISLIIQFK